MAKKAKIDLLELNAPEKDEAFVKEDVPDQTVLDAPVHEAEQIPVEKKARAWKRLPKNTKWIGFSVLVMLLAAVVVGHLWFNPPTKPPTESIPGDALKPNVPSAEPIVILDHFVVDVRNSDGAVRMLFCDIAVELADPRTAGATRARVDVRNVIFNVLKSKQVNDMLMPEGRNGLKGEIKEELNRLMGDGAVKNVYFSRFEVI
jgi:flagellar basal body-associated protein FliL